MLVWIGGAFGVGKSALAAEIVRRDPGYRVFDPDSVGRMLREQLAGIHVVDWQDLRAWREQVPMVAGHLAAISGQSLVVPGTVLKQRYWRELLDGLADENLRVHHVVLDADRETLVDRIRRDRRDRAARTWRLDHVTEYEFARDWLRVSADQWLNAGGTDARVLAGVVLSAVKARESI